MPLSDAQMDALAGKVQGPLSDEQMDAIHGNKGFFDKALGYAGTAAKALDSVTGAPTRAAIYASQNGQNPFSAGWKQFANMDQDAPSGKDIAATSGASTAPVVTEDEYRNIQTQQPTSRAGLVIQQQAQKQAYDPSNMTSQAGIIGQGVDLAANPLNLTGPVARAGGKALEFLKPVTEAVSLADKPNASAIASAAERLGFKATPGMKSASETVQGLESSLSQSPSIPGALVRKSLKPAQSGLEKAAEDLVSSSGGSSYSAGNEASKGVVSNLGEKVSNIKMAYEPFNKELPKMIPSFEDKAKLADEIAKIGDKHIDPNEVSGLIRGTTNRVVGSENLADIEETRKLLNNKITKAYSDNDHALVDTLTKIKDKLSDFRDNQFQSLAQEAYPGAGGTKLGQQMVSDYKNAMSQHASLMNDLRDVGPLFGIKASNPRDFIEAFSEIPSEQVAKKLFQTNNYQALQKVQQYFPEEFDKIKNLKLQDLRQSSLSNPLDPHNSNVDPVKLVSKINKLPPEVQKVLFGEKAQKLSDMQTVLGAYPEKIGPSGTPKGEMFTHMADPMQQASDAARYGAYRAMANPSVAKVIQKTQTIPQQAPQVLRNIPQASGPGATILNQTFRPSLQIVPKAAEGQPQQQRNPAGYSEGGYVPQSNQPPVDPRTQLAAIDPQKAKQVQDSMRKAFNFATGGMVPGTPQVPYNSPQNDKVLARVSPGEDILPLSVTQSSNPAQAAANFVRQQQMPQPGQTPPPAIPAKGPEKWANDGFQNLKANSNEEQKILLDKYKTAMLIDPKAKQLLITASNYQPGSKPLEQIMKHLANKFEVKK